MAEFDPRDAELCAAMANMAAPYEARVRELETRIDNALDAWREMMSDGNPTAIQDKAKWALLAALEGRPASPNER